MGVLRGDHGCRLLPPVPTVTIESHGCPGDAGAGRAAAPVGLTSGRGGGAAEDPALDRYRAVRCACGPAAPRGPWGPGQGPPDGRARAGSAPRTAAARAAGWGLRTLGTEGPGSAVLGRGQASVAVTGDCYSGRPGSKQSAAKVPARCPGGGEGSASVARSWGRCCSSSPASPAFLGSGASGQARGP